MPCKDSRTTYSATLVLYGYLGKRTFILPPIQLYTLHSKPPSIKHQPKGYSKRSIYNMVMFYEEYSSETFFVTIEKYLNSQFVQPTSAQIETQSILPNTDSNIIVQMPSAQIVQTPFGQMPRILELTTLSDHTEILCRWLFYAQSLVYEAMVYVLYP